MRFLLFAIFLPALWAQCPPGYILNPGKYKCFMAVSDSSFSFMEAQRNCSATGGALATIENAFENTFAQTLMTGVYAYWMGLANMGAFGWTWLDGTPLAYKNWAPSFPGQNDTCAMIDPPTGVWYSEPCIDLSGPFLCTALPMNQLCPTQSSGQVTISQTQVPSTCTNQCPSGWTYYEFTHSCYTLMFKQNFIQAENECELAGAHLASIHSTQEDIFVSKLASTGLAQSYTNQVWIGIRRVGLYWVNNDGSKADYVNFIPGHPNATAANQNCAELFADPDSTNKDYETKWNDIDCETILRAFVCKKPATH